MMESVAVMAGSVLSSPPTEASARPVTSSAAERQRTLAEVLAMKVRLGYELVSETEFGAVVCTPSPRRWLGTRAGRKNQHLNITVDETGRTHLVKSHATA
jgi:hypothetical protein